MSNRAAFPAALIVVLVGFACDLGKSDADYTLMDAKLTQADVTRHSSLIAAIRDRPSHSALALLQVLERENDVHRAKVEVLRKEQGSGRSKRVYLINMEHFNKTNQIIRQHGFGEAAQDFNP